MYHNCNERSEIVIRTLNYFFSKSILISKRDHDTDGRGYSYDKVIVEGKQKNKDIDI